MLMLRAKSFIPLRESYPVNGFFAALVHLFMGELRNITLIYEVVEVTLARFDSVLRPLVLS